MTSQYVNESTSIIQLDAFNTPPGWSTIVYISSSKVPGHMVTIRDQTGLISTPKRFLVSSTGNVFLSTGISTLEFNQPFSYLSLVSLTSTLWTYVNLPPLYGLGSTPSVDAVQAPLVSNISLTVGSLLSSGAAYTTYLTATSSLVGNQVAVVSSLTVNGSSPAQELSVNGAALVTKSVSVGSNLTVRGPSTIYIAENASVGTGGISTLGGSLTIGSVRSLGAITMADGFTFVGGNVLTTAESFNDGPATVTGLLQTSTLRTFSASTLQLQVSTIDVKNSLTLGTTSFVPMGSQMTIDATIVTPSTTLTGSLRAAVSISTPLITLREFNSCSTASSFTASSLHINNDSGSLEISSIRSGVLETSTFGMANFSTSGTLTTSTLSFSDEAATSTEAIQFTGGTTSTIPIQYKITGGYTLNAVEKALSTSVTSVDSLFTSSFAAPAILINNFQTSTLGLRNSLTFSGSTVNIQRVTLSNIRGSVSSSAVTANALLASNDPVIPMIRSTGPVSLINTTVQAPQGSISTHSTVAYVVENLSTNHLIVGTAASISAPAILQTDVEVQGINAASALTSTPRLALAYYPYQYRYGTGRGAISPTVIHATTNYQQYWSITSQALAPARVYLNMQVNTQTTDYSLLNTVTARVNNYSTLFSFVPAAGADSYVLSNADITGIRFGSINPVFLTSTPYIEFRGDLNGKVVADITTWLSYSTVQADTTVQAAAWNSNEGIQFRNGSLRFPNQILGTTIYNGQNDTATRNLTYTGSIYSPSDSTLKDNIEAAALDPCVEKIGALPLRRFTYTGAYASTFQLQNYDRLGLLTTDVTPLFSGAVTTKPFLHCGLSTVNVIQDEAIQYSHLGATQVLLKEIAELRAALSTCVTEA